MHKNLHYPDAKIDHLDSVPKIDNNFSWDDLRIFLACAREQSFRKSAHSLKVSSSTVVRRIGRLEDALGLRLFNRLPEGVILTHEGQSLVDCAIDIESAVFDLIRKRKMAAIESKGSVTVSITEGLGSYWLMPRLISFQREFPFLTVDVQCAMRSADVLRLEADVAIQFEKPISPDLIVAKIGRLHVYPFASQNYLNTYGYPKNIKEAKNHRFVQQVASQLDEKVWATLLGLQSIDEIVGVRTNSSSALLYAIERGGGIGALPTYAVALGAPVIPVDIGIKHSLEIWITYHPDVRKTRQKAQVIDWLKSIFDPRIYPWFRDDFIHPNELDAHMPTEAKMNIGRGFASVTPSGR